MNKNKARKAWMVWGLALLIMILGYMGFRSLDTTNAQQEESDAQAMGATKYISNQTQPEQSNNASSNDSQKTDVLSTEGEGVTIIGDSVTVGIEPYLKEKLPKINVDGKVGRQMSQAESTVSELKAQGKLGDRIIIELGTNGPFSKKHLQHLLTALSDAKQVIVVTTRVPKGWQDSVNSTINDVAQEFDNAQVVDWYAASEGKGDYFYKDGVHLKPDGGRFYADLLIQALEQK
ncbi:hypothetical protein [Paenibacillus amylolyticus]|uniref:SGNH/GDSL hydrolase family protein n=1 Tax=Paenibacillus amylolyticus TaxID=1451 RepID=UPI0039B0C99C